MNTDIFKSAKFKDNRGYFLEIYNQGKQFYLPQFVQSNLSFSKAGTLRGLHFQVPPHAQGKHIFVISGAIYDVIVDINQFSPTYGHWWGNTLKENESLFMEKGFAHGFYALKDSLVLYNITDAYNKEAERSIIWNDPDINIEWPVDNPEYCLMSEKDRNGTRLKDL